MSGGVRNLRAMFENKDTTSTSPPDRGRSPAGSIGGASSGTSPRPLSKVRTSFVTVERSGQMGSQLGLKRDNNHEPSMSKRRTSFSINEDEDSKGTAERKQSIAEEIVARKNSAVVEETIPEVAVETPAIEVDKQLGSGHERGREPAKDGGAKVQEKKPTAMSGNSSAPTNGAAKPGASKSVEKPAPSKSTTKPAPISTAKTYAAAKTSPKKAKTPMPKTPTTPRSQATKSPERKPERKPSRASLAPSQSSKSASKPTTSTAHGSAPKTRIGASPPQTGFHKPRPKSPTKPVKLPASLTAHTPSSGSKTASTAPQPATNSRRSLSRASDNTQPSGPPPASTRSESRATTTAGKPTTNKTPSGRPSLGPPPSQLKKQPSRQSLPSSAAPADESFLARMMRPTTASAQKTADKPPTTPPKRVQSAKKPVTKPEAPKLTKPEAKKETAAPKKAKEKETGPVKSVAKNVTSAVKRAEPAGPSKTKEEPKPTVQETVAKETWPIEQSEASGVTKAPAEKPEVPSEPEPAADIQMEEVEEAKAVETEFPAEAPSIPEAIKEEPVAEAEPEIEEAPAKTGSAAVEKPVAVAEPVKEEAPGEPEPAVEKIAEAPILAVEEPEPDTKNETVIPDLTPDKIDELIPEAAQSKTEEVKPESVISPKETKTEPAAEDPEDVGAREEFTKLNAELMKGEAEPTGAAEKVEPAEDID